MSFATRLDFTGLSIEEGFVLEYHCSNAFLYILVVTLRRE